MLTLMILSHFKGTNAMTKAEIIEKLATLEAKVAEFENRLNYLADDEDDDGFDDYSQEAAVLSEAAITRVAQEFYRIVKYPNGPTIKKWQALLVDGKFPANQANFIAKVEEDLFDDSF